MYSIVLRIYHFKSITVVFTDVHCFLFVFCLSQGQFFYFYFVHAFFHASLAYLLASIKQANVACFS